MKLILQIPCNNEEEALQITLPCLPRTMTGVNSIEWLVVDDGSTDNTIEIARRFGVDHVIRFPKKRGLAKGFLAGIEASLKAGADIIVNLDADNQYCADDIPKLIAPILDGSAEIVIGARPISQIKHFSRIKKLLQCLGSAFVRMASHTEIADAPSGFRAFSRSAALRINVFSDYTYTLETLVQAGRQGIPVLSVPVRTNPQVRPSRLLKGSGDYVRRSFVTVCRMVITYCPMQSFLISGAFLIFIGLLLVCRWLIYFMGSGPASHIPSLVLASILIVGGVQFSILAFVADLMAVNRTLLEDIQFRLRESQCGGRIKDRESKPFSLNDKRR